MPKTTDMLGDNTEKREHFEAKKDLGMGLLVQSLHNMSCLHIAVPTLSIRGFLAWPSLHLISVVLGTAIPTSPYLFVSILLAQ